jgi:hypothetical protein
MRDGARRAWMAALLAGPVCACLLLLLVRGAGRGLTTADYLVAAILTMVLPVLFVVRRLATRLRVGDAQKPAIARLVVSITLFGVVQALLLVAYFRQQLWIGALVGGLLISSVFQVNAIRKMC